MISLAPSPLFAAVTIPWPPPPAVPPDVLAELTTWLGEHCGGWITEALERVVVDEEQLQVFPDSDLFGFDATTGPLVSHLPAGVLAGLADAGALLCAAIVTDETEAAKWRCNVQVDQHGRHRGDHVDGRYGDEAEWPNGNPADTPPPARPAPPAPPVPSVAAIRGVIAAALWLCHHDPAHPLSYTDPDTCKTCLAIDRAAAAVHAMIGDPA